MSKADGKDRLPPDDVPTAGPGNEVGRALRVPSEAWRISGAAPSAVRIVRPGRPTVAIPLLAERVYVVGRAEKADLWFEDETVSRQHALLFFVPELSCWALRDNGSGNGTLLQAPDGSAPRRLPDGAPVGLSIGSSLQLGDSDNRLEFLEAMPPGGEPPASSAEWKAPASKKLEADIQRASRLQRPIFLLGASGTGKMYVAHRIHELSEARGRFVYVNCGALPPDRTSLHSELLGHLRGAFTGATEKRTGKLFEAEGGTLFLDEVESLVPEAQVFLLDLLEDGNERLTPLGAPSSQGLPRPDFRLISASKQPLEETPLRRDLAQRLALGDFVYLPSLHERREDIPLLVNRSLAALSKRPLPIRAEVSEQALAYLMEQRWPGEVRELMATVQTVAERVSDQHPTESGRLVLGLEAFKAYLATRATAFGRRTPATSPETVVTAAPGSRKRPSDLTKEDVEGALSAANGNRTHAARLLGVALNTLKKKIRDLGLT